MNCLGAPTILELKTVTATVKSQVGDHRRSNLYREKPLSEFSVREFKEGDISTLCSWVTSAKALKTVSGDSGECLTPKIFRSWVDSSIKTLVVCMINSDDPLGFCTLTCSEIPELPCLNLEICHLLVKPTRDYFAIGHLLCTHAKSDAHALGYKYLWGRVVHWNSFGKHLAEVELSNECSFTPAWIPKGFHWYVREISQSSQDEVAN